MIWGVHVSDFYLYPFSKGSSSNSSNAIVE